MRTASLFGAAIFAASCLIPVTESLALDSPRPLSGRELQVLLLGNTLIGLDEDGPYWMYYPSADTLWGRSSEGDVDVGRWWIENNSYCRAWRRWFNGQTRCWQMARAAEDQVFWYSLRGESTGRSILREGNAMGDVPSEVSASSQLADAGTGLATALDAVVARAVVSSDEGVGPRDQTAGGTEGARQERPFRAGRSPSEIQPPLVVNVSRGTQASSAAGAAAGAAGGAAEAAGAAAASSGFNDTRLGGFLDRIGVRSASPAGGTTEAGGGAAGGAATGGGGSGSQAKGADGDRG